MNIKDTKAFIKITKKKILIIFTCDLYHRCFFMTTRKTKRTENWTKSRDYLLGSLFSTILTAITDPKDNKAIRIKTDPDYAKTTERKKGRWQNQATTTTYSSRI